MHRLACLLGLALLLPAATSAASPQKTGVYRVVAVSASARLTYTGRSADFSERTSGTADLSARKARTKQPALVTIPASGSGRLAVKLSVKLSERATISQRSAPTQPYVEQRCSNSTSRAVPGGIVLRRLSRGQVEARWAFRHAAFAVCPGPVGIGKRLVGAMKRAIPASSLTGARVTFSLSGTTPFHQGFYTGSYRWRATLTLSRV